MAELIRQAAQGAARAADEGSDSNVAEDDGGGDRHITVESEGEVATDEPVADAA